MHNQPTLDSELTAKASPSIPAPQHRQDAEAKRILVTLAIGSSLVLLLVAGSAAVVIGFRGSGSWWHGWVAALVISVLATCASLAAVAPGILAGAQAAAYGYLAGAVVRMLVALVACIAAVAVFRAPPIPTLLLVVPLYFGQVAAEALILGRAFWARG